MESNHHRITDILEDYWNEKRGKNPFPSIEQINMDELDIAVQDRSFLIHIEPIITKYVCNFQFLGKKISEGYEKDKSGKYIKHIVIGFLETPNDFYDKVIQTKKPLKTEEVYEGKGGAVLKYRQILLPLGDEKGKPINGILGGMRFIHGE